MYEELIDKAKKRIEDRYQSFFNQYGLTFQSGSLDEIVYTDQSYQLVFAYPPERYEYGKSMVLKAVYFQIDQDKSRRYEVSVLVSFLKGIDVIDEETLISKYYFQLISNQLAPFLKSKDWSWEEAFIKHLS